MICHICGRTRIDPMTENSTGPRAHLCGTFACSEGTDPRCRPLDLASLPAMVGKIRADLRRTWANLRPVIAADDAGTWIGPALRRAARALEDAAEYAHKAGTPRLPREEDPGALLADACHDLHRAATRDRPDMPADAKDRLAALADRCRRLASRIIGEEVTFPAFR